MTINRIGAGDLIAGDLVYGVIEVDLPDDHGEHTWKIGSVRIASASTKLIVIETMVQWLNYRRRFPPDAVGHWFHLTPHAALEAYRIARTGVIASAERAIATARRAIAWVDATRSSSYASPPPRRRSRY